MSMDVLDQYNPLLYRVGRACSRFIAWFFGRPRVYGRDLVPLEGGLIIAPNHTSYLDPPLSGSALLKRPVFFMAKSELFAAPILGKLIARVGAFPVRRGSADREALRTAYTLLQRGHALVIFLEGGTSKDGRLQSPEMGMAMVALKTGVPVVPTAIINADKVLPYKGRFFHFAPLTVVFGEPLTFPHLAGKNTDRDALREVSETVMRRIADLMRAHGAADRVPEGYLESATEGAVGES